MVNITSRGGNPLRLILVAISIGLIIGGIAMVLTDVREFNATGDLFDGIDDPIAGLAEGTCEVSTNLRDQYGNIVRTWEIESANIIEPESDLEVVSYEVAVSWTCTGTDILWSTLNVGGAFTYVKYVGVDDLGNAHEQTMDMALDTESLIGIQNGQIIFDTILADLIPDPMYPDGGGGENFNQETSWDHAIIFVFSADFSLSVSDVYDNIYDSYYNTYIELRLAWSGSDFDVNWDDGDEPIIPTTTTTTTTTTTRPTETFTEYEGTTATTYDDRSDDGIDIELDTDMMDLESGEFIYLSDTGGDSSISAATIFGGTVQEDIGVVLIGVGMVVFVLAILVPGFMKRK